VALSSAAVGNLITETFEGLRLRPRVGPLPTQPANTVAM
jgi:hypothetical protein